jgi:hypothetical protein
MTSIRIITMIAIVHALAACSGDAPGVADPKLDGVIQPEYPLAGGVYDVEAPITAGSGLVGARYTGSIELSHAEKTISRFSGSYAVRIIGPQEGEQSNVFTGSISGQITTQGIVTLEFRDDTPNIFQWVGTLAQGVITGTWQITAPDNSTLSGSFTATRR